MGSRWTWFSALAVCQAAWLPGGVPSRSAVSFHSPRTAAATMNADYYGRLGVTRNAEDKDIKNVSAPRTARSRTARSRAASAALLARADSRAR